MKMAYEERKATSGTTFQMSQITHSQLALKKRSTPVNISDNVDNPKTNRKSNGHNDNGHKNDKDIIIIDDEYETIPVAREEIVEDDSAGVKKKRNRRSKNSADSRESSEFSIKKAEEVTPKQNKSQSDEKSPESISAAAAPVDDFPTPEASPKATVGKLTIDALHSKRRSDRLQNASTIVNLSTVSSMDQSTKVSNDTLTAIDETPLSERRVSARRTTRQIDDIKFYRTSNAVDDSINVSTNATIGSEIAASMLETPATDRKRRIDSVENIESPKRSRLDLSALFNNFYSPVSLLRNKFKRTNLASTPKAGAGLLDDSDVSFDSSAADMKEIELNEKVDEAEEEVNDDVKIIVKPIKKSSCSIM